MDIIGNMLVTILNAQRVNKKRVVIPYSKFKEQLANYLKEKGMVGPVRVRENDKPKLIISLKYEDFGDSWIKGVKRISTPGRRLYVRSSKIPYPTNDAGMLIISTSQGLMNDSKARELGVGGELLCEIW